MTDQTKTIYDLPALIDGNADSILAKLSDLTLAELIELRALEDARAKPRKTVQEAIDAEAGGRTAVVGAASSVAKVISAAPLEAADVDPALETAENVILPAAGEPDLMQAVAKIGVLEQQLAARDATIAGLEASLAELQGKTGMVATPAPKALALPKKPVAPEVDDYAVVFGDSAGRTITSIKPLHFGAAQFEEARGALKLLPKIEFGREGPAEEVCSAWLVKGSKPVARCQLMVPLAVCGGRLAVIPAGYLAFRA